MGNKNTLAARRQKSIAICATVFLLPVLIFICISIHISIIC